MPDPTRIDHAKLLEKLPAMKARCECAATDSWTWHETLDFACEANEVIAHYEDLVEKLKNIRNAMSEDDEDYYNVLTIPTHRLTEILGDGEKAK